MPYKDPEKQKEYMEKWREENKEERREYNKKWYEENKEKKKEATKKWVEENPEYRKKWKEENKERVKEYNKKWVEENPEYKQKWREENRERVRESKRNWEKEKYHTDPCYKLRTLTSKMVRQSLKEGKGGESMLPYVDWNSYKELKEHLESQFEDWMTWENHGVWHPTEKRWHIDHIKPQSVLLEGVTSMDDPKFRECWALENLRPLEAMENILKTNKLLDE